MSKVIDDEWKQCKSTTCHKCKSTNVKYYIWESSCGGFEDAHYKCFDCNYDWWVDGIDS